MRITSVALAALAFAGCVTDDRPEEDEVAIDWRSGGKGDGETCDFAAMSAASYYKLFAYQQIERPNSWTWYRVGLTFSFRAALANGDGADLSVYFLPSDRVIIEYAEQHRVDATRSEVLNETIVVTHASIDPATKAITIAGVGTGAPFTVTEDAGCGPGIAFKYTSDLRSAGLAGKSTVIQAGLSSGRVIDPDHLEDLPETMRRYFEEDVASGKKKVIRL